MKSNGKKRLNYQQVQLIKY